MIDQFVEGFRHIRGRQIGTIKKFIDKPDSKHPIEDPNSVRILEILYHESIIKRIRKHIEICDDFKIYE